MKGLFENEYDLESELEVCLQFFTDRCYKKEETYCIRCRKVLKT